MGFGPIGILKNWEFVKIEIQNNRIWANKNRKIARICSMRICLIYIWCNGNWDNKNSKSNLKSILLNPKFIIYINEIITDRSIVH